MKPFLSTFCRVFTYFLFFSFLLFTLFLIRLLFFECHIPQYFIDSATNALSTRTHFVDVNSATFRFSRGLRLHGVRVLERHAPTAEPVLSATRVDLNLNLGTFPWSRSRLLKSVSIHRLRYPRLPKGYYIPDSIEFPGQPDFQERDTPLHLALPQLAPFELKLVQPEILNLAPAHVLAGRCTLERDLIRVEGIRIQWTDFAQPMTLTGGCCCDFGAKQTVQGEVHGTTHPDKILPLMYALDITNSYQFFTAFSKIEQPVEASCRFGVNLRNGDLHLNLGLHPVGGFHHGVPLRDVAGPLDIRVFVRDTYQNAQILVGPLMANLGDGNTLSGTVFYENTNDVGFVTFRDVRSTTTLSNSLAIADIMTDGTLDCLQPGLSPTITVDGRLAVDPSHAAANDLRGTLDFSSGTFFSIPLRKVSTAYHLKGTDVHFAETRAESVHGGKLTGTGQISIPEFEQARASFQINLKADSLPLRDLADALGVDSGDRHGTLRADIVLSGPLQTNLVTRIKGHGTISCTNGNLAQMKFFRGLSAALDKIPGLSTLIDSPSNGLVHVTFDHGKMDFKLEEGVLHAPDITIEGAIFSIKAAGTYNIEADNLDLKARVFIKSVKTQSFGGKIASLPLVPLTWAGSNIIRRLLDFRIFGPLNDPKWENNRDLIERLK